MRPLFVTFSDPHIHVWETYNKDNMRTQAHVRAMLEIGEVARDLEVPILMPGDLFHGFGKMPLSLQEVFWNMMDVWEQNGYPKIWGISGNHDQESANYDEEKQSRSSFRMVARRSKGLINALDFSDFKVSEDLHVFGLPYVTYNKSFDHYVQIFRNLIRPGKYNILLIHTDLHGAKDASGREFGTVEEIPSNMKKYFRAFDMVLDGHLHQPQQLASNIVVVGSPIQQKRSDAGCEYGYWIGYEKDKEIIMKFKPLKGYPEFIELKPGEEAPDNKNFYITATDKVEEDHTEIDHGFSNTASKEQLATNYLKVIGESSISKRKALINILTEADHD